MCSWPVYSFTLLEYSYITGFTQTSTVPLTAGHVLDTPEYPQVSLFWPRTCLYQSHRNLSPNLLFNVSCCVCKCMVSWWKGCEVRRHISCRWKNKTFRISWINFRNVLNKKKTGNLLMLKSCTFARKKSEISMIKGRNLQHLN